MYTIDDYIEGRVPRGEVILCPFHKDHKPSGRIRRDSGRFHCWVCGAQGDQTECAARLWFKTGNYVDNIIMADALIRRNCYPLVTEIQPKERTPLTQEVMAYLTEWCHRCGDHLRRNASTIKKLQVNRSIQDPVQMGLGLAAYEIFKQFYTDFPDEELAIKASLIYDTPGHVLSRYRLSDRIIVPEYRDKKAIYYVARAQGGAGLRYLCPKAKYGLTKPVLGWDTLTRDRPYIWIVEGAFDMLPLAEAGEAVIATSGLSLGQEASENVAKILSGRNVIICFDNDKVNEEGFRPGQVGAMRLRGKLHAQGIRAQILAPPLVKDVGEWVTSKGVHEVIREGKAFASWY